jgi:thiol:disulfide interchange protein
MIKKLIVASSILVCLFALGNCGKKSLTAPTYSFSIIQDNLDSSKTVATAQNKNIFLMVHADWCSVCQTFKTTVLQSAEIKNTLSNGIVTSLIDGDKTYGKPIATQYNVGAFPTYLILDKNGVELKRRSGTVDEATFKAWVTPYLK